MTKTFYILLSLFLISGVAKAQQTTAMDFNQTDCNGGQHHLYSTLDSNKVVILEFFMLNCMSCVTAGDKMLPMHNSLDAAYPGRVQLYNIGFDDSYTCSDISNWVSTNGYDAFPMDSGGAMLAYYGGFGMSTIVVLAGVNHDVLYTGIGFSTSDTTQIGSSIRNFFQANPLGVNDLVAKVATHVFPIPATDVLNVSMTLQKSSDVKLQIIDISGRVVNDVYNGRIEAGAYNKQLNTLGIGQGLYFLRTIVNGESSQTKINIVR